MDVTWLSDARPRPRRIAIGEFDGVHLGHREVIAGNDTVLTFEPHPLRVVRPEAAPRLLTSLEQKTELIAGLGVDELVVVPFDERFAHQSPEEFVDHVLVERLGATHVSVGENFRFGRGAAGDSMFLQRDTRFTTTISPLVESGAEIVSSSRIRALVAAGEVERATRLLGAPFQIRGQVVPGDQRGRTLGYPTANIVPDESLVCPGQAVYAAYADGTPAAVNVGVRPTFGTGRALLVEAYLLDTDTDLYGRTLKLDFIARLRGERRFDTVEALVEQMGDDVRRTRELLLP